MNSLFTSPFGLLALITDPKVLEAAETINNKEKIKLRWCMLYLTTIRKQHLLPMTKSSTNFSKVASTTILINVGNKLSDDCGVKHRV